MFLIPGGGSNLAVDSLQITSPATKTTFNVGEYLNTSGLVVTAVIGSLTGDVKNDCIITPTGPFTTDQLGDQTVTISYGGLTCSYPIRVKDGLEIVPWSTGTDAQIAAMLEAYYNDELDFNEIDGWDIGAERTVSLSAMPATGVSDTHSAQNVKMVLMHKGGIDLTTAINGHSKCAFVVGMKDVLCYNITVVENGSLHSGNINNWANCARRSWCNNVFKNSIPSDLRECFKEFKDPTYLNGSLTTINDYFALNSVAELFGNYYTFAPYDEGFQFDYYKTSTHRDKYNSNHSDQQSYWIRTFKQGSGWNGYAYYRKKNDSAPNEFKCTSGFGLSPFGVI